MTLVIAKLYDNKISIVSDTKLDYSEDKNFYRKEPQKPRGIQDGAIKVTIINPDLCIAFAGNNIDYAEQALMQINDDYTIDRVKEIILLNHKQSNQETDYIIAVGGQKPTLFAIKNGAIEQAETCWIGCQKAFSKYQASKNKQESIAGSYDSEKALVSIRNLSFKMQGFNDAVINEMNYAIDEVINDVSITTVAHFRIGVVYNKEFRYNHYSENFKYSLLINNPGLHIVDPGNAQTGDYSINLIGESSDFKCVALYFPQGEFGILYKRINKGLLKPQIKKMPLYSFLDLIEYNYAFRLQIDREEKYHHYQERFQNAVKNNNFEWALKSVTIVISCSTDNSVKADYLYNKGLVHDRLNDNINADIAFSEAMSMKPELSKLIYKHIKSSPNRRK